MLGGAIEFGVETGVDVFWGGHGNVYAGGAVATIATGGLGTPFVLAPCAGMATVGVIGKVGAKVMGGMTNLVWGKLKEDEKEDILKQNKMKPISYWEPFRGKQSKLL